MKMIFKLILSTMLVVSIFWGTIFVTLYCIPTDLGLLIGFLLGLLFSGWTFFHYYPIWFKIYIDNYWKENSE